MYRVLVVVVSLLASCAPRVSSADVEDVEDVEENNVTCTNYNEHSSGLNALNVTAIEGVWKARELVLHLGSRGVVEYDSCPIINITEVQVTEKPRQLYGPSTDSGLYHRAVLQTNWWREFRHLRLLWDEDGNDVEYSLYFKNDSVGFWNSHGDQNGTLPVRPNYKQFTGTVQVLKAVGDHLLLHFCQAASEGHQAQLFSVLFSREPRNLHKWEVEAAHALLRRKNLSVTTRRLVCGNSASGNLLSAATLLLALAGYLIHFKAL